jgi:hypothetical protein
MAFHYPPDREAGSFINTLQVGVDESDDLFNLRIFFEIVLIHPPANGQLMMSLFTPFNVVSTHHHF